MTSRRLAVLLALLFIVAQVTGQDLAALENEVEKARVSDDKNALAQAWYNIAKYHDNTGETDKSNQALRETIRLAKACDNFKLLLSANNYFAANLSLEGKHDSAILYFNYAIEAGIKNNDSLKIASVLINLADEYATSGDFVEAANHGLMAIRIKETLNDSSKLAYFYQKVGEVYKLAGENEKWESYIKMAYQLIHIEKCAPLNAVAAIYNDLGGIAETKADYAQALLYYDTLINIGKQNEYNHAVGIALSNSATILKLQGNYEQALKAAIEARNYRNTSAYQQIYDNNLLAELYLANHNLKEARKHAELAIADTMLENFPEEKMRTCKICYQIEKQASNFKKALYWNELYKEISDNIRDKEIRTRIVDMEVAYQTEKKEQHIQLLTAENKLKSQQLKTGFFLLAILITVVLLILYILQIRRKQANLIQNDLQQQVLRSQMNPHFIFNVLGSIQNFLLGNDNKKAAIYLAQFASLTRATLEYSATDTISLANEINMLKNYMELEMMRKPGKFGFKIIAGENLESDFINIPPMMIQPFVENAIKHGFSEIDYPGLLTLTISDKNQWIEFVIEDNGKGLSSEGSATNHRSMAMEIFEKRRKLIQQKHKKEFKFEIKNLKDLDALKSGVQICINVPVLDYD
ncbi:MAG: histidine kinase [Draconibacterium sp.]